MQINYIEYEYKAGNRQVIKSPKVIGAASPLIYRELRQKAKEMRSNPTDAEKILWNAINNNRLGFKFRQQHIINRFIVDFYCVAKSLALELDGGVHDRQKDRDAERDNLLNCLGVNLLRFPNDCVINNLDAVIKIITEKLEEIFKSTKRGFKA